MYGPGTDRGRAEYLKRGREGREALERHLPDDWAWAGKTVLDFGCGAGRTIRHLLDEAPECELWGSDIDPRCIEWDQQHLAPASFVLNEEVPPLPFPDGKFDLIYAYSVFTHLSVHWAAWLLELDRVLAPDGRILASFMSEGMCEAVTGEPWDEENIGMNVYEEGQDWSLGGPMVMHSPWWIEDHWGRLFTIERIVPRGFQEKTDVPGRDDHGAVVLRKSGRTPSVADLERLDPTAGSREAAALHHDVLHLRAEVAALRAHVRAQDGPAPHIGGRQGLAAVWAAVKRRLDRLRP
jgi:SAM-dependent methyltransferase